VNTIFTKSTWINPSNAKEAISIGTGKGIKVAIIDSGIELAHHKLNHLSLVDDLAFIESEEGVVKRIPGFGIDVFGHGTAVAGVIKKISPQIQLGSFRVMDDKLRSKYSLIEEAARTAIERGYSILNCSFGSRARLDKIQHFKSWVDLAYKEGVHIVSACNNSNFRDSEWPGFFPSVITVNMARTESDDLFFRSDSQPGVVRHLVEFAAKGVDLNVLWKGNKMKIRSGSSFAAPHVSGLLANLLSVYPGLKPPVAKALMQEIAINWDKSLMGPNF